MDLEEQLVACRESITLLEQYEKELLEQVAKQKVPVIRHGDYGYWGGNKNDPVVFVMKDGSNFVVINGWCICTFSIRDCDKRTFVKTGNLFDDLKG